LSPNEYEGEVVKQCRFSSTLGLRAKVTYYPSDRGKTFVYEVGTPNDERSYQNNITGISFSYRDTDMSSDTFLDVEVEHWGFHGGPIGYAACQGMCKEILPIDVIELMTL